MGERFEGASLANLIEFPREGQEALQKWMKAKKHFLIYLGGTGIGKTHLCSALVPWMMTNFKTWRYWEERELLRRVRASMSEFKGDFLDSLKHFIDDDVVILNDVASQAVNDFREDLFFDFIDDRYNSRKPTIITSNLTVKDFKKTYHARICSRLFSSENTVIERVDCQDLRQKGY